MHACLSTFKHMIRKSWQQVNRSSVVRATTIRAVSTANYPVGLKRRLGIANNHPSGKVLTTNRSFIRNSAGFKVIKNYSDLASTTTASNMLVSDYNPPEVKYPYKNVFDALLDKAKYNLSTGREKWLVRLR